MQSMRFMEERTGIQASPSGTLLGKISFSKRDLDNWRTWYEPKFKSTKCCRERLKDHLDNVRMVLPEEQKSYCYPPASMETAQATIEEALYSKVSTTRKLNLLDIRVIPIQIQITM